MNRCKMTGLKHRISSLIMAGQALRGEPIQAPYFTVNGERGAKPLTNRQIRLIGRNIGVSVKEKQAREALTLSREEEEE